MSIGTYEYISDDGTSYLIRMNELCAKFIGVTPYVPSNAIQPEKIKNGKNSKPIECRYIWLEEADRYGTPDNPLKKFKVIIPSKNTSPGYSLFLDGGMAYLGMPVRVLGAVGEKRIFYGD